MKRALRPGPRVPHPFRPLLAKEWETPGTCRGAFCIGDKTGTYLRNRFVSGHGFSRAAARSRLARGWETAGPVAGLLHWGQNWNLSHKSLCIRARLQPCRSPVAKELGL